MFSRLLKCHGNWFSKFIVSFRPNHTLKYFPVMH